MKTGNYYPKVKEIIQSYDNLYISTRVLDLLPKKNEKIGEEVWGWDVQGRESQSGRNRIVVHYTYKLNNDNLICFFF